jgi:nucleoside-diphosphate-sugar epimerase
LEDIKYKKEIEIFDPTAKRPHLHVLDCVKILSKLIMSDFDDKILNIGFNELNVSKIELINIMKTYINFNHITHQTEDSRNYHVNFDLLLKYVDYIPITYSDGIKDYLKLE